MSRQTAIQTTATNTIQPAAPVGASPAQPWSYLPAIDVMEHANRYDIICDAPGMEAGHISITFENGALHVHGPVAPRYPEDRRFLRQEYGVGDFDRLIPLGRLVEFVDTERAEAEYRDGVLTIGLPKLKAAQARRIAVKSSTKNPN